MSDDFARQLRAAGMRAPEAQAKETLFERIFGTLRGWGHSASGGVRAFFVPGRIEFLGKHTDYAGGRSLLCAAERGFCLATAPRGDAIIRIRDCAQELTVEFALDPSLAPAQGHWANYPMTVARRIARNFPAARCGADIAFESDLPSAAGLASSSAFVVAAYLALAEVNQVAKMEPYLRAIRCVEDLAGYLGTIENGQSFGSLAGDRGVGTFGGSEDHTAMLCCRAAHLSQYSFCPVRQERRVALPQDYVLVVGVSGVAAEKTGPAREAYNRASRAAQTILELWRAATGRTEASLAAAAASAPDAPDRIRQVLRASTDTEFPAEVLLARLEQFLDESTVIIPAVGEALARGNVADIGPLVDRSQANAERLLGNQIPETVFLARASRTLGAAAASAFGAGFGGSVWALVRAEQAEDFAARWAALYKENFPQVAARAQFFITGAGPAALRLS